MIKGIRVMNITIDEGGVPPHIKPLIASIVSAIERGNWGEVTHSTCTAQELEEAQDDLAEALEESEASLQEVKEAGGDLVEKVENFCNSPEVAEVSMVLKEVYEVGSDPGRDEDYTTEPFEQTELRERIKQAEANFVGVVEELKTYANGKYKDFEE